MEAVSDFYVRKPSHITESRMGLGGRVFKMFMPDCGEGGEVLMGSIISSLKSFLSICHNLNY